MQALLLQTLAGTARLPFLALTPACVFLGYASAVTSGLPVATAVLGSVLAGALAAHVSVNALNEYLDFRSGLDMRTTRTPFSGGSGALLTNPAAGRTVLLFACVALAVTVIIGCWLVYQRGPLLLGIGLLGVIIVLSYTPWLNRWPLLCLIAPGLAFGPLMVVGTCVALTGSFSPAALAVSLPVFFLVNNLLLLNQFPDVEADLSVGRRHVPIVYGLGVSLVIYVVLLGGAAGALVIGVQTDLLPPGSYLELLPLLLGCVAGWRAYRYLDDQADLRPALALNVATAVLTPCVLGVAMLAAG